MKRAFVPCLLFAAVASACAQSEPLGIRVRLAYGFTPKFDANGGSHRFQGPELGVAIPVGTAFGQELLLEPSFFGGGRLRKGGDDDSDVYRFTLFAHHTFAKGLGVRAGVGYASSSRARSGAFDGESGVIVDLGVEIPFELKQFSRLAPYVDLHTVLANEKQLQGFFLGIGAKL